MHGYPNGAIAEILSTSERTVNDDLRGIFDKLGVSGRLELVLYALHDRLMGQFYRRVQK